MSAVLDGTTIEQRRKAAPRVRKSRSKHQHFESIAQARYVIRKAFRIADEQAKSAGLDPLAHQALIQIYGSPNMELQVNQLAERLDITPAFTSNLLNSLVRRELVSRKRGGHADRRVTQVNVTEKGKELLHHINDQVRFHIPNFTRQLTLEQRQNALSILMFFAGMAEQFPNLRHPGDLAQTKPRSHFGALFGNRNSAPKLLARQPERIVEHHPTQYGLRK